MKRLFVIVCLFGSLVIGCAYKQTAQVYDDNFMKRRTEMIDICINKGGVPILSSTTGGMYDCKCK